ncbi:MAG: glycosyltransferase [Paludibacter sp.]|nr:glycosyltransferase [Paludibacter sp.]
MGAISADQVSDALNNADIVLHVESFKKNEKMKTRLSFSTKIVDCLASGWCVMDIGWHEAASIDYFIQNDAALVAFDEKSIAEQLKKVVENPDLLNEYAQKAWECGKRNHQIEDIQHNLYKDIYSLVNKDL